MRAPCLLTLLCVAQTLWADSLPTEFACLYVDNRHVGRVDYQQRATAQTGTVAEQHFRIHVRGARNAGDLRVSTRVERDRHGELIHIRRQTDAAGIRSEINYRRDSDFWSIRRAEGGRVHTYRRDLQLDQGPIAAIADWTDRAGGEAAMRSWFDPLDLRLIDLRAQRDPQGRLHIVDTEDRLQWSWQADRGWSLDRLRLYELNLAIRPCSARQANRRGAGIDPMRAGSVALPYPIDTPALADRIGYVLQGLPPELAPPESAEQRVRIAADGLAVIVCARCQREPAANAPPVEPPTAAERAANAWVDSDHPTIRQSAGRIAGSGDDITRMLSLRRFVRKQLWQDVTYLGYAPASAALASRQGDCTEHALLLAALARAVDIPARIVYGLAYRPPVRRQKPVLLPHVWMQAWIDGRWQSFDAAQEGFSAGHLALAIGNGDPSEVDMRLSAMRDLRVKRVAVLH